MINKIPYKSRLDRLADSDKPEHSHFYQLTKKGETYRVYECTICGKIWTYPKDAQGTYKHSKSFWE